MTLNDVIALILRYFTDQSVSAVSGPKFTILSGHVEEVGLLVFSKYFFPIVDTCFSCEDSATALCDGAQMAIFNVTLRPAFQRAACSNCILNSQ